MSDVIDVVRGWLTLPCVVEAEREGSGESISPRLVRRLLELGDKAAKVANAAEAQMVEANARAEAAERERDEARAEVERQGEPYWRTTAEERAVTIDHLERERDEARRELGRAWTKFHATERERDEARAVLRELVRLRERQLNAAIPTPEAWLVASDAAWSEARRIVAGEKGGA